MKNNYFFSEIDERDIKKERSKARELRKTQWWKRKCFEGKCHFCRKKIASKELTMEHVVPIIRGGKSTKGNLVPACKECNSKKKYMLPLEWEEYLEMLRLADREK